jgi:hypothetical protein
MRFEPYLLRLDPINLYNIGLLYHETNYERALKDGARFVCEKPLAKKVWREKSDWEEKRGRMLVELLKGR